MQFEPDALHELLYTEVCRRFQLCAQLIVMMISLVADAYQLNHKRERVFAMRGAISYDTSMFSFGSAVVDIWTVGGCERIYLAADAYRDELLTRQRGRVDLIYRSSKWYLAAPCNRIDTSLNVVNDLLDVDISVNQSAGNFNGRAFLR